MQLDLREVEEICKTLYVQALKVLPADIKAGFKELVRTETNATGRTILDTMIENIAVAERTRNILCQDTGIPIYNVVVGRDVEFGRRRPEARSAPAASAPRTNYSLRSRWCIPLRGRTIRPPAASGCRSSMSISTSNPRRCRSR